MAVKSFVVRTDGRTDGRRRFTSYIRPFLQNLTFAADGATKRFFPTSMLTQNKLDRFPAEFIFCLTRHLRVRQA
jgi:hypothetical protein